MGVLVHDYQGVGIAGRTELFCIIADPIAHVRTPQMFNAHLQEIGADAVLVPCHVRPKTLPGVVGGLRQISNLRAIIVTVPHKIAMVDLCDALDPSAEMARAVNVVRVDADGRLIGANFDGIGFLRALEHSTGSVAGKSVYMAGAGGVARAIAFSLAGAGIRRLAIHNRSIQRAEALLQAIRNRFPAVEMSVEGDTPENYDIAINATSLGLDPGDPLPFSIERLPVSTSVADVVMQPAVTRILAAADARGMRVVPGGGMLEFQLALWVDFIEASPARGRLARHPAPPEDTNDPTSRSQVDPTC